MKKPPYIVTVLDRLSSVKALRSKSMFGGYGLYSGAYFFGLVWQSSLFLFTDEESRKRYKKAGMGPFVFKEGQREGNYFEIPAKIFDNEDALTKWAEEAVECRRKFEEGKIRSKGFRGIE
jgi:DNA transformation protein